MIKSANNCSSNSIIKHFKQGSLKSIAEIKEKYQNDKQGKKKYWIMKEGGIYEHKT